MWIRADAPKYMRGKYKRHQKTYDKGGRKKHYKNVASGEYGQTGRSVWKGAPDLWRLSKGITESHTIEENRLFSSKREMDSLLESLKAMEKKKDETETQ